MGEKPDLQALWKDVDQALRRRPGTSRALWDAVSAAVPLTIEDDALVIGFEPKDMRHASYVETRVNKAQVQEVLQAKTGRRLDLKCIEGATVGHWDRHKEREAERVRVSTESMAERQTHKVSHVGWEELLGNLQVLFADTPGRRHATVQAHLLVKALPLVYDVEMRVRSADPESEQIAMQGLNRAFDRIATVCELPPSQVALEYLRYKSARKASR